MSSFIQVFQSVISSSWPWYLVRASGWVAAISLFLLLLSGVGFITGRTFQFLEPIKAWASHRVLGIVFGVSVLIHVFGLLFDKFVPFNLGAILVPWLSSYRPVTLFGINFGSLYVALGVIALYLTVVIVASSLTVINRTPRTWKWIHLLSYLVGGLVFIHALYLGTDLVSGPLRLLWWLGGITILAAVGFRLWRAKTV